MKTFTACTWTWIIRRRDCLSLCALLNEKLQLSWLYREISRSNQHLHLRRKEQPDLSGKTRLIAKRIQSPLPRWPKVAVETIRISGEEMPLLPIHLWKVDSQFERTFLSSRTLSSPRISSSRTLKIKPQSKTLRTCLEWCHPSSSASVSQVPWWTRELCNRKWS